MLALIYDAMYVRSLAVLFDIDLLIRDRCAFNIGYMSLNSIINPGPVLLDTDQRLWMLCCIIQIRPLFILSR